MKVKIDKERFHNILMKLFSSMIGRIKTRENETYMELYDKNEINFAEIWFSSSLINPKRCKNFLGVHYDFLKNFESFVPVLRKKQYAKALIYYVYIHTGYMCDCVEFYYDFEEEYDDDEGRISDSSSKKYIYKKGKKK
jgi:hypothetical protein